MKKYKGLFVSNIILTVLSSLSIFGVGIIFTLLQVLASFGDSENGFEHLKDNISTLSLWYTLAYAFIGFIFFIIFILNIVCGAVLVSKTGYSGTGTMILVGTFLFPLLAFIGVCIGLSKINKSERVQFGYSNSNNFYNPNSQNNFNGFNQNNPNNFNQGL